MKTIWLNEECLPPNWVEKPVDFWQVVSIHQTKEKAEQAMDEYMRDIADTFHEDLERLTPYFRVREVKIRE